MSTTGGRNRGRGAGPANRRALIAAAREVFAEHGYAAPLSAVARRAGVGQGSLYRHFPDRTALAVAVFGDNLAELETLATRPDTTLADLFDLVTRQALASTALIEMVTWERHDPRVAPLGTRFGAVVTGMLDRDQREERIGAHVAADDVMLAISMLATVLTRTDADQRAAVARRARLIFEAAFAPGREAPVAVAGDDTRR